MEKGKLIHAAKTTPGPSSGKTPKSIIHVLVARDSTVNSWAGTVERCWGPPEIYDQIVAKGLKPGSEVGLELVKRGQFADYAVVLD